MPTNPEIWQKRQEAIRELLARKPIGSQTELLKKLAARGFRVTQSSVSRDLREMHVAKADGRYVLPETLATEAAGATPAPRRGFGAHPVRARAPGPNVLVVADAARKRQRASASRSIRRGGPTSSGPSRATTPCSSRPPAGPDRRGSRPASQSTDGTLELMTKPIVLAFSGGLDTSFCIPWLREQHVAPTSSPSPSTRAASTTPRGARSRSARSASAPQEHVLVDAREAFFDETLCVSRDGQRAARRHLPALRRRRAHAPGAQGRGDRARARRPGGRARLHRGRQRPGPLRGRAAHARAGPRGHRSDPRRGVLARAGSRRRSRPGASTSRRSAPRTRSTAASGACTIGGQETNDTRRAAARGRVGAHARRVRSAARARGPRDRRSSGACRSSLDGERLDAGRAHRAARRARGAASASAAASTSATRSSGSRAASRSRRPPRRVLILAHRELEKLVLTARQQRLKDTRRRVLRRLGPRGPVPRAGVPRHRGVVRFVASSASPARCGCACGRVRPSSKACARRIR